MSALEDLAAALYRLQWDADLYATPRGPETKQYERRAKKLMAAGYYKKDVDTLADQETKEDVLARHRINHRYDTALHDSLDPTDLFWDRSSLDSLIRMLPAVILETGQP